MKRKLNLQLFAEGEGAAEGTGTQETPGAEDKGQQGEDKKFTQADLDKAIQDRLKRENKKYEKQLEDLKKQFTAGGDGEGNANAEGQQEDPKAAALLAQANQRLLEATATTEAVKLGVDPKYVGDVVRLANLSEVQIGEDGTLDSSKVSKAIDEVLKRLPMFKTTTEGAQGFVVGGSGKSNAPTGQGTWQKETTAAPQSIKRWNRTNRW